MITHRDIRHSKQVPKTKTRNTQHVNTPVYIDIAKRAPHEIRNQLSFGIFGNRPCRRSRS